MRFCSILAAVAFVLPSGPASSAETERRVVQASVPEYPELMYLSRKQGKFLVALTVLPSGEVSDVVILESPARYFDREIVAHVRRWRFEPHDVSSVVSVEFVFRLLPRKTPVEERGVFFIAPRTIEIRTREPGTVIRNEVREPDLSRLEDSTKKE